MKGGGKIRALWKPRFPVRGGKTLVCVLVYVCVLPPGWGGWGSALYVCLYSFTYSCLETCLVSYTFLQ